MPVRETLDEREHDAIATHVREATAEAQNDIRRRDEFHARWRETADYFNGLVAAQRAIKARRGEDNDAFRALQNELTATHDELVALRERYRNRAFDDETLKQATRRRLLMRGVKPSQLGRWERPDLDIDQTAAAKTQLQDDRSELVGYYERSIAVLVDMFEDARAGAPIFAPIGEVVLDRHGRRYASRYPTPMDAARQLEQMRSELAQIRPRTYTRKRKVARP